MGGKGSGGARPGAGRKSKRDRERWLHGSRGRSTAAKAPPPVVDHQDVPTDLGLTTEERLVWLRLAPEAMTLGTLTPATEYQFGLLCQNIVLERELRRDLEQRGGSNHRGIIQRIDAELLRFCLAPMGKPIVEEKKPEDPFAEFDAPPAGATSTGVLQ